MKTLCHLKLSTHHFHPFWIQMNLQTLIGSYTVSIKPIMIHSSCYKKPHTQKKSQTLINHAREKSTLWRHPKIHWMQNTMFSFTVTSAQRLSSLKTTYKRCFQQCTSPSETQTSPKEIPQIPIIAFTVQLNISLRHKILKSTKGKQQNDVWNFSYITLKTVVRFLSLSLFSPGAGRIYFLQEVMEIFFKAVSLHYDSWPPQTPNTSHLWSGCWKAPFSSISWAQGTDPPAPKCPCVLSLGRTSNTGGK